MDASVFDAEFGRIGVDVYVRVSSAAGSEWLCPLGRILDAEGPDSPEHRERVLAFADRLREDGIDANVDQYLDNPSQGWQAPDNPMRYSQ